MNNHIHPLPLPTHQDGIDPGLFRHFLAAAPPGAVYVYHVGFLLWDRDQKPQAAPVFDEEVSEPVKSADLSETTTAAS